MTTINIAEVELDLLRAVLTSPLSKSVNTALEDLAPIAFIDKINAEIWDAYHEISIIKGEAVDPFLVLDQLENPATKSYFNNRVVAHECSYSISAMAKKIATDWVRRSRLKEAANLSALAEQGRDKEVIEAANNILSSFNDSGDVTGVAIQGYGDLYKASASGKPMLGGDGKNNLIRFGIPSLDDAIVATPGTLGIIAAKTSAGKSALAIQAAIETVRAGGRPLLVSLEMEREEVAARIVANVQQIDSIELLLSKHGGFAIDPESEKIVSKLSGMHGLSGQSLSAIEAAIRKEHRRNPFTCIILDYFTLLQPPDLKSRSANMAFLYGELSKALKRLASQLGITIAILSQFNRNVEDGKEPTLENLRETGQLEQDASWVLLLWTEKAKYEEDELRTVLVRVAKNRLGRRWRLVRTTFAPWHNAFSEQERTTQPLATEPKRSIF